MQRGCAVRGGRMSEPEEVVFMDVELTVTPIIVLGDGDRIIYKNAAAKKLLPFCRKGTTINRYPVSYTHLDVYKRQGYGIPPRAP